MTFRRGALTILILALMAAWSEGWNASAQPAPTATPVILVPPTRTPGATPTGMSTPVLVREATRAFPPTNTPRPTPPPTASPMLRLSGWPHVAGLIVEPGVREEGVFRVEYGMVRVRATQVSSADRVVFFISANRQPPTILGVDDDLSDGASVSWLVLSREMDALITAVAANGSQVGMPALPIHVVFSPTGR